MAYLTKDDLFTHMYGEIVTEITRGDNTIPDKAISAAIGEVKSYLNRFDLIAMFGTSDTEPTYENEYLKSIVKDVACWHILKLANPNIDMAVFRSAYEDAIKYLINIQKGLVDPGYPAKPDDPNDNFDTSGTVGWSSNPKRSNYY